MPIVPGASPANSTGTAICCGLTVQSIAAVNGINTSDGAGTPVCGLPCTGPSPVMYVWTMSPGLGHAVTGPLKSPLNNAMPLSAEDSSNAGASGDTLTSSLSMNCESPAMSRLNGTSPGGSSQGAWIATSFVFA